MTTTHEILKAVFWVSPEMMNDVGENVILREINPDGLEIVKIIRTDANTQPNEYNSFLVNECLLRKMIHYEIILRPRTTNMNINVDLTINNNL